MSQLSIVIPATGLQKDLDDTLVSVLENRPQSCEVIVPHSPTYQDPYNLSDEVNFVCSQEKNLAALINAGISSATAETIHVLKSGVLATTGWTDTVLDRFKSDTKLAVAAPLLLNPTLPDKVLTGGIRYLSRGKKQLIGHGTHVRNFKQPRRVDGPSLQAAFFRRSTLSTLGPLSGRFGSEHMETDLAARLRGMNQPCECIVESQVIGVSIERLRGFCSAQHSELLFWHHRRLTGRLTGLLSHGGHVAADLLLQMPFPSTITAALGRTVGAMRSMFSQPCTYEPVEKAVVLNLEQARITRQSHRNKPSKLSRSA